MDIIRQRKNFISKLVFQIATIAGIFALIILLFSIFNEAFGYVIFENEKSPAEIYDSGIGLENASKEDLVKILENNISKGLMRRFNFDQSFETRDRENVLELVIIEVVNPTIVKAWALSTSIFQKKMIIETLKNDYPEGNLEFRSWLSLDFLFSAQSSIPEKTGIITALTGSLMLLLIAIILAFPLGVGTALYLEEYARPNKLNKLIQLNIYNLAGIPSIIYGMLGLAVFVRFLEPITSGNLFNNAANSTANGRTILSAGLTLGLLILPIIIINAQEAIRAVPKSLKFSSYGLGATKWQTIWSHILPYSMDRILTGSILAVSRALGETAPLIVVGASTFVAQKPDSIFSKFTALPIQIYQWTARPQPEFRKVAAAAIIVLLILLLTLNAGAVMLRNHHKNKKKG
ncbi:MAG: phosphate ABC transporter permease PstA [Spirochaetia bacterium]|jgi:phosphate transport system permease protein|nr:phosphate ABC transporter permease PstA [Spirochaetia bacterium]